MSKATLLITFGGWRSLPTLENKTLTLKTKFDMENNTSTNHENGNFAKPMLAAGLSTEHDLKTAIALGLDKCWDSDWIISTSKSTGGAIHFSVHLDYIGQIDTDNVEIKTIEMDGCWLRLSGWVK